MPTAPSPQTSFRESLPEKVCIIIPPSPFLLDERVFMPLGPLKVAASLEARGIVVDVLDLSGIRNYSEVILEYAQTRLDVTWFGITATSPQLPATIKIAEALRSARGDTAKLILGGPHITLVNAALKTGMKAGKTLRAERALSHLCGIFDKLVAGDGEDAVFQVFDPASPQLIDADDPKSKLFLTDQRLDELPFPARHLVDVNSYHYSVDGVRALSLIAQLGCPFACGFCGGRSSAMLRKIRKRTSQSVVDEMVHLHTTYGVNGFMLYDDELNVNPQMLELMELIATTQQKLGVEWRLRGFIKSQLFNEDQARTMYQAGFRWILVGFESGSEDILQAINKKATRDENTRCMEIAHRHNLKVKALMSMGHPGETLESIRASRDWLIQVKPADFDMAIITPYPGTPYYDQAVPVPGQDNVWVYTYEKTGARLYQDDVDFAKEAQYYKGDPNGGYHSHVFTDTLSREDLVRERGNLEKEVRAILGIPFNPSAASTVFEHSMGQRGQFPQNILKLPVDAR